MSAWSVQWAISVVHMHLSSHLGRVPLDSSAFCVPQFPTPVTTKQELFVHQGHTASWESELVLVRASKTFYITMITLYRNQHSEEIL